MLKSIYVQNFALIRELHLNPDNGLNVITGETGAGKSILLGALGLVLGNRADHSVLYNKDEKCIVEVEFDISNLELQPAFEAMDLDYDNTVILRREITPQEKSRAFVNDTPVQLSNLKFIAEKLVEIQTQHATNFISNKVVQLHLLDDYSQNHEIINRYSKLFKEYVKNKMELEKIKTEYTTQLKEKDFIQFQFDELDNFSPKDQEEITLLEEIDLLTFAEEIKESTESVSYSLTESEQNIVSNLNALKNKLRSSAQINPQVNSASKQIENIANELKEISRDLQKISEKTENNTTKLDVLNERASKLQMLLKKHNVESAAQLIALKNNFQIQLESVISGNEIIEKKEKFIEEMNQNLQKIAEELSSSRKIAALTIANETESILRELEIPDAKLQIEITYNNEKLGENGCDDIGIFFSANTGKPLQAVEKIASGGELSRLVFTFKSLLAHKKNMPTLIFDEADTGISGRTAARMGNLMQRMAASIQIISITHLPQIAASGNAHFFVFKQTDNGIVNTNIKKLSADERIQQIAHMLSGEAAGDAALANARELLGLKN